MTSPTQARVPGASPRRSDWLAGLVFSAFAHASLAALLIAGGTAESARPQPPAARAGSGEPGLVWIALEPALPAAAPGPSANEEPQRVAAVAAPPTASEARPAPPSGRVLPRAVPTARIERSRRERSASHVREDPEIAAATPPVPRTAGTRAGAHAGAGVATAEQHSGLGAEPAGWPGPAEVDRPARPRWPIHPEYPAAARRRGEESTVLVEAWVDDVGQVAASAILASGGDLLDRSALDAVARAAFRPASLAGQAVPSRVALRIHFRLR